VTRKTKAAEAVAEPEAPKPIPAEVVIEERRLPVAITDEQRRDLSMELVALQIEIQRKEEERVKLSAEIKSAGKDAQERTQVLRSGLADRDDVKVEITYDFDASRVIEKRVDTGEVVADRAMSWWDRQQNLPGMDGDAPDDDDSGAPDPDEDEEDE
jgi:hypothetical protein